ncbi:hypothetical protein HJ581_0008085 [Rhodococcus opacus]|nr:hypothetical protein HJ581_0008085 [Rhodococcus opacus]
MTDGHSLRRIAYVVCLPIIGALVSIAAFVSLRSSRVATLDGPTFECGSILAVGRGTELPDALAYNACESIISTDMAIALGAIILAVAVSVTCFGLRAALPTPAPGAPSAAHRGILD